MQDWPLDEKIPNSTPANACSMSASARTMVGDLPPSSSEAGTSFSPAIAAMDRPVSVPPVNPIRATRGWRTRASPTIRPLPGRTERRAVGRPNSSSARVISRPRARETRGSRRRA